MIGPGIAGGGQFNAKNHFDNPNDGPMCKDKECTALSDGYAGANADWIGNALGQVNANRTKYGTVAPGDGRGDISAILNAFGQNSHALADFYAHSNWVDAASRGGYAQNKYKEIDPLTGKMVEKIECGWVPAGLNNTVIWDEDVTAAKLRTLYTGTVQLGNKYDPNNKVCGSVGWLDKGDIVCESDKTTHGYWNKDHDALAPGESKYTSAEQESFNTEDMFFWKVEKYSGTPPNIKLPGLKTSEIQYGIHWYADEGKSESDLKKGDRIYVAVPIENRHRMAFYLAIEHTKQEVDKLYKEAEGVRVGGLTLQEVFAMDKAQLDEAGIQYQKLFDKQ